MRRQRNSPQIKEQEETPVKELNEMEASNLSDREFKVMDIRMPKDLRAAAGTRTETVRKSWLEGKSAVSEAQKHREQEPAGWVGQRVESMDRKTN